MRRCRNPSCGHSFTPVKPYFYYCCWACRLAHVGEGHEDRRGWQRERNAQYDRGFWDGNRAQPERLDIPPAIWKGLMRLSHPDKWQDEPGLLTLATDVTRWLLEHRPQEPERRGT
jgi:hypothetical protein